MQAASGSDPTVIAELGLTATPFDFAPTLTALPGEFKRLDIQSGLAAAPNIVHLTAYDTSAEVWEATGFALYLDDGTLFAAYTQETPVQTKAGLAFALFVQDIVFASDFAGSIAFGDAIFTWPPATEETRGVAEIATQDEVDAQADDEKIVTPAKLGVRLDALLAPISAAIAAEAVTREADDSTLSDAIDAQASTATFAAKGHLDIPVPALGQTFRVNWGKKDVAAKTATTDSFEAPFSICYGVFQGGGTTDVNSSETIRAYPAAGAASLIECNLTNGTSGVLTLHWIAIGLAS
ncbi:hypothetical protein [Novosphingobium sp. KN65.2]|uniref:hypothetical protein n=1 Tax=Novosphingobium sp. KN65.2 TaxID=1478134 RepID=UPI0012E2F830|nr:hypothetical protein [Novosphingobium sp. KN65.2]